MRIVFQECLGNNVSCGGKAAWEEVLVHQSGIRSPIHEIKMLRRASASLSVLHIIAIAT